MQHGGDVEPALCDPVVGNRLGDDNHDACVLHNSVSPIVPQCFFQPILAVFFFVFSMCYKAGLSSPLAGDVTCNTRLKISAAWQGPIPFNLWQAIRVINYLAWAIPKA